MVEIVLNPAALEAFLAEQGLSLVLPTARLVQARQEQLCPRDSHTTRHMADNIRIAPGPGYADVGPTRAFWWARMLETGGNTNRKPRPFIRPSADL